MEKALKDILREQMQVKGVSVAKLRQQTGIAERYLLALLDDVPEKLPAAPYARGYLIRIASALELDGNALWEAYRTTAELKTSGAEDRMPENRFALRRMNRKLIAGVAIAILAGAYLISSADRFLGRPNLELTSPTTETSVTTANIMLISGMIEPGNIVSVGGEEIEASANGQFETSYRLEPGLNSITISTKNPVIGRKNEIVRQVIYEPEEEPLTNDESFE